MFIVLYDVPSVEGPRNNHKLLTTKCTDLLNFKFCTMFICYTGIILSYTLNG